MMLFLLHSTGPRTQQEEGINAGLVFFVFSFQLLQLFRGRSKLRQILLYKNQFYVYFLLTEFNLSLLSDSIVWCN